MVWGVYVVKTKLMTFPCRPTINLDYPDFFDVLIFLIMTTMLASGNATIAQPESQWNGSFLYCQSLFCRWNGSYVISTKMFLWYSIKFYFHWLIQSNRFGNSSNTIIHMGRTP